MKYNKMQIETDYYISAKEVQEVIHIMREGIRKPRFPALPHL